METYNDVKDKTQKVIEQYKADAENVDESMNKIYEMANALKNSSEEIVSSVSGITETIGQATIAVNDVAEKTTQVVTLSDEVKKARECIKIYSSVPFTYSIINQ